VQAQDVGLGYELNLVSESNKRLDGPGAIRPYLKGFDEDNCIEPTFSYFFKHCPLFPKAFGTKPNPVSLQREINSCHFNTSIFLY
jgi:hypothetical protein